MASLDQILRDHGLEVEPKKCKAWVPEDATPNASIKIPVVTSGLPILGTAAQAIHSTLITSPVHPIPMVVQLADATMRAEQANNDASLLIHMVETTCEVPVRYAAWLMLVRCLAVRMDFDMRVLPADLLTPLITSHTAMLFRVAKHILGLTEIDDLMLVQMQLPGQ